MTADTKTLIQSNGSKWAGEDPDTIEELLRVLKVEPLDKTFEKYGDFFSRVHREDFIHPDLNFAKEWDGSMHFFGNFRLYSHVFNIHTFDQAIIVSLISAIEDNKQREDYKNQEPYNF